MEDSFKQKGQRKRLVDQLRAKGILDESVLEAILNLPRHYFFPQAFLHRAYEDAAFPIDEGQTISQPYTVAFQTALLRVQPGDKVLEIGTGSGYQAAILAKLGAEVHTIERVEKLYRNCVNLFEKLKLPIHVYWGDGSLGLPGRAPFSAILVTAAAPGLAEILKEQLAEGGRLVIPVGNRDFQKMVLIERDVNNNYRRSEHGDFKFVPLIGKHGWEN